VTLQLSQASALNPPVSNETDCLKILIGQARGGEQFPN
jgi:hypothetical protein